jgi:signal transduction histidine kinase
MFTIGGLGLREGGMNLTLFDDQFFWLVAHELRSPLTTVNGYLEMLLDEEFGPITADQREPLEIVNESAQRLQTITSNLLDAIRVEAGQVELVLQPTDLLVLVEAVAADFKPQLEAKAQRLLLDASPGLPPALCDERRAVQIVGNLLSNASEHTPQGGLISVGLALAEEEGFLQVAVADAGAGISAEGLAGMPSRSSHAESARLIGANEAGLVVQLIRSLVELHGGHLWFESEPDGVPTFHATFPIAEKTAMLPNEPAVTVDT